VASFSQRHHSSTAGSVSCISYHDLQIFQQEVADQLFSGGHRTSRKYCADVTREGQALFLAGESVALTAGKQPLSSLDNADRANEK